MRECGGTMYRCCSGRCGGRHLYKNRLRRKKEDVSLSEFHFISFQFLLPA